jgi:hypothetical protein
MMFGGGAVGAMLASAFGSFECKSCGQIPRSEFPPEDRSKMLLSSLGLVVGSIVLLIAVIALLIFIQAR